MLERFRIDNGATLIHQTILDWLLSGPPWVRYRTLVDLLREPKNSSSVLQARQEMLDHPAFNQIVSQLEDWPGYPLKRHNDAHHHIHRLSFLVDLGWQISDPGASEVVDRILAYRDAQGLFQILMNIHPRYGGRGEDQLVWMLCDAPVILYSLLKLGLGEDPQVQQAGEYLISLVNQNGWPCAVSEQIGKFRGPGRKTDPCPYATLIMLKSLAQNPPWRDDPACAIGVETLLTLWERRKKIKPYLFAMGTHFARLKAPLIWYDILHVLDVLSQFPIKSDPRFLDMLVVLDQKANGTERYTAESVWDAWKDWEFGQKKEPSYWITFLVYRIFARVKIGSMG